MPSQEEDYRDTGHEYCPLCGVYSNTVMLIEYDGVDAACKDCRQQLRETTK